jgi:hypothetical protein
MGRTGLVSCGLALLGGLAAPIASAPQAVDPPPLKLDIDKAVRDVLARQRAHELPHFEERIEVRDAYRDALEAHLHGAELECGASAWGPPTRYEMNGYRGSPIPVHADFTAGAKLLYSMLEGLFSSKEPRWFLYAVRRTTQPGAPGPDRITYVIREGRVPEHARLSVPGTSFDLIAGFRGRTEASSALRRLERGFPTLKRAHADDPPPPWFATPCPLPRFE